MTPLVRPPGGLRTALLALSLAAWQGSLAADTPDPPVDAPPSPMGPAIRPGAGPNGLPFPPRSPLSPTRPTGSGEDKGNKG